MVKNRPLTDYPRPNVAVDVAVLTALTRTRHGRAHGSLGVLIVTSEGSHPGAALPGRFLRERETVAECVTCALEVKAGLTNVSGTPRLLKVFDDPARDPRAWTLSLAHSLVVPADRLTSARGELRSISLHGRLEAGPSLLFDHDAIVAEAAAAVRERYERLPDPDGLLDRRFTMAELRVVHEAVLGEPLLKDTFRRRMEPNLRPILQSNGAPMLRSDGGRPAQVYERDQNGGLDPSALRRLRLPRAAD